MIRFKDREDAGRGLADSLAEDWVHIDVVYGIPRGGLVTGAEVARRFGCPLMPVLITKIRHPLEPELAIGAMDVNGRATLRPDAESGLAAGDHALAVADARAELARRQKLFAGVMPAVRVRGSTAVLVDDGLATGQTCLAALRWVRSLRPAHLLLAVPCASASGLDAVRSHCSGVVTLAPPDPYFTSVGAYYESFGQVESADALALLRRANEKFFERRSA